MEGKTFMFTLLIPFKNSSTLSPKKPNESYLFRYKISCTLISHRVLFRYVVDYLYFMHACLNGMMEDSRTNIWIQITWWNHTKQKKVLHSENVDTYMCINSREEFCCSRCIPFTQTLLECMYVHMHVNKYFKIIHYPFPLVRENKSILKKVFVVQIFLFYFISKTNLIPCFITSLVWFVLYAYFFYFQSYAVVLDSVH